MAADPDFSFRGEATMFKTCIFDLLLINHDQLACGYGSTNPHSGHLVQPSSALRPFYAASRIECGAKTNLDLHQLGDRAPGFCARGDRLECVVVDARYLRGDGEMHRGDRKAVAVLLDGDF